MMKLTDNPTLLDYQKYVAQIEKERGFDKQCTKDKCILLGEEIGELFKAIRKREGLQIDSNSIVGEISTELVDIFTYVCSIANQFEIDLEKAFRIKEEKNKNRTWQI